MTWRTSGRSIVAAAVFQAALAFAASAPDPLIEAARTAAASYAQSLPDYIVKRITKRSVGSRPDLNAPGEDVQFWRPLDVITGDVAAEHGKEVYTNITVNGTPVKNLPGGGEWSAGEFSTVMLSILPPERAAVFTRPHAESIRNIPSVRYDFAVDEKHSAWHLAAGHLPGAPSLESYTTAYAGTIWIDRETGQVMKIDMSARGLPSYFPLSTLRSVIDYDLVKIGDQKYLLPTRSDSVTCQRGTPICLKNETVFENYDKFSANTNVTFGDDAK